MVNLSTYWLLSFRTLVMHRENGTLHGSTPAMALLVGSGGSGSVKALSDEREPSAHWFRRFAFLYIFTLDLRRSEPHVMVEL